MPKAPSAAVTQKAYDSTLKRNQACHQCRKRKLRCDAKRPCSTCVRSHAYAARLAHPETIAPMECTYDDFPAFEAEPETSQARFERLESRIKSLEAMMGGESAGRTSFSLNSPSAAEYYTPSSVASPEDIHGRISDFSTPSTTNGAGPSQRTPSSRFNDVEMAISTPSAARASMQISAITSPTVPPTMVSNPASWDTPSLSHYGPTSLDQLDVRMVAQTTTSLKQIAIVPPPIPDMAVLHPAWPLYLPPPDLLYHLVDVFFTCLPHANRLLHRGRFMANLALPPDSPSFPLPALLHAICAVASFYSGVIDSPPLPRLEDLRTEEVFPGDRRKARPNQTFGESHALWSNLAALKATETGRSIFEVVQSLIVLSWYYYTSGSMINVWVVNGKACRLVAPMGLNIAEGYASLSPFTTIAPVIAQPKDAIEAEERRNALWLIYAGERLSASQTSWSMLVDDEDISQYLPLPDELFNFGREYPQELRQRLATPDLLTTHPEETTSPFSLYVKSVYLLSKVKAFNCRARNKHGSDCKPKETADFQELDKTIEAFVENWPKDFRHSISLDGVVDPTLYTAKLLPWVATIMLHDPHVNFSDPTCESAKKIQDAVCVILEFIYKLGSTSFDVMLLDHYCSFCWFVAGAAIIRMLKTKFEAGAVVDVIKLNSDIEVIKHMLVRLSEKTVVGRRLIKMLNELYDAEIGVTAPSTSAVTTQASSRAARIRIGELINSSSPAPAPAPPRPARPRSPPASFFDGGNDPSSLGNSLRIQTDGTWTVQ